MRRCRILVLASGWITCVLAVSVVFVFAAGLRPDPPPCAPPVSDASTGAHPSPVPRACNFVCAHTGVESPARRGGLCVDSFARVCRVQLLGEDGCCTNESIPLEISDRCAGCDAAGGSCCSTEIGCVRCCLGSRVSERDTGMDNDTRLDACADACRSWSGSPKDALAGGAPMHCFREPYAANDRYAYKGRAPALRTPDPTRAPPAHTRIKVVGFS